MWFLSGIITSEDLQTIKESASLRRAKKKATILALSEQLWAVQDLHQLEALTRWHGNRHSSTYIGYSESVEAEREPRTACISILLYDLDTDGYINRESGYICENMLPYHARF